MWRIIEAYDQINAWIRASEGQFIDLDNGESYRFMRKKGYSGHELEAFEAESGVELPPEYKRFLIGVGTVELFVGPLSAGIEVLGPEELQAFSNRIFEGFGEALYPDLLPAVSIPKFGGFGGFKRDAERAERYGVFYPEGRPKSQLKTSGFGAFDEWVADLVESRAKRI